MIQALGVWNSSSHSVCIPKNLYSGVPAVGGDGGAAAVNGNMFVFSYDCESVPHAENSGMLVQGGGTVQVHLKNVGAPTKAYIVTHHDCVLEIRNQGGVAYS